MSLEIHSSAFAAGKVIPERYTCQGENISPPLEWSGVPENARSLVLVVEDPDAPDPRAPTKTWVHWILYNIPVEASGLAEGVRHLPPGTGEGVNDWQATGYGGPCPPIGRHRYVHRLYALDRVISGLERPTRAQLDAAMAGHILDETELIATFRKH